MGASHNRPDHAKLFSVRTMQDDSPIRALHEFARRKQISAEYRLEKESGPIHAKIYTVRLHLGQKEYLGTERTMQLAQRAAAQLALADQSVGNSSDEEKFHLHASPSSPVLIVNNWAVRNHLRANFVFLNEQFVTIGTQTRQLCFYRLHLGSDLHFDGHGSSHQQARSHCALNALHFLRQQPLSPPSTPQLSSAKKARTTKSDISLMYERAKQLGLTVRTDWDDPLTVTYRIGEEYLSTGQGFNRHLAKQQAAEKMLSILRVDNEQRTPTKSVPAINPITRLYQLAQARQVQLDFLPASNYSSSSDGKFTVRIQFGESDAAEGHGPTKQSAKRAAAELLMEKLDPALVLPPPPSKGLLKRQGNSERLEKKRVQFVEEVIRKDEEMAARPHAVVSPTVSNRQKQQLLEACRRVKIDVHYSDEQSSNDQVGSSRYQSIVSLSSGDRLLAQFRGHGPSLMRAQENASSAAWNHLKQLFNGTVRVLKSPSDETPVDY